MHRTRDVDGTEDAGVVYVVYGGGAAAPRASDAAATPAVRALRLVDGRAWRPGGDRRAVRGRAQLLDVGAVYVRKVRVSCAG
ncbi:hypothetical protein GCM10020220_022640 [Nonomuraea rubra]